MHGFEVNGFNRPYAAVTFEGTMEKIRKNFLDPQAPSNLQRLNENLTDIHNVMTQNIQEIIERGALNITILIFVFLSVDRSVARVEADYTFCVGSLSLRDPISCM